MMEIRKDLVASAFCSYTSAFDSSNLQIANKIRHTWHVAENCSVIASSLAADAPLAWLIGVLHDIGRFEQIRVIHGYHGGTVLRDGIRRRYAANARVRRIELGLNQGETDLILREF